MLLNVAQTVIVDSISLPWRFWGPDRRERRPWRSKIREFHPISNTLLERHSHLSQLLAEAFLSLLQDKLLHCEVEAGPVPAVARVDDDHPRPGRFLILGSSSPDLLRQSSPGRPIVLRVHHPVSPTGAATSATATAKDWRTMLWRGGFPRSWLAATDARSFRWRENYIQGFVERDLRRFGVELNLDPTVHAQALADVLPPSRADGELLLARAVAGRNPPHTEAPHRRIRSRLHDAPASSVRRQHKEASGEVSEAVHPGFTVCSPACWTWTASSTCTDIRPMAPAGRALPWRTSWPRCSRGECTVFTGPAPVRRSISSSSGRGNGWGSRSRRHRAHGTNGNKAAAALLDLDKLFVVVPQGDAYPIEADRAWVTPLDEVHRFIRVTSLSEAIKRRKRHARD